MAINTSKVLVGGLAAGVVMNVIGFVVHGMLMAERMRSEMAAAAPTLAERPMTGMMVTSQVITQFIVGLLVVWLYAAMRPRFGAGMKTASYAAVVVWICGFLFYQDWLHMGLMSGTTYAMVSVIMLVTLLLAAWVGGWLYSEDPAGAVPASV